MKNCQLLSVNLVKLSFIKEKAIKTFSDKGLLREFIASRSILKEWLKGVHKKERNSRKKNDTISKQK